MLQSLVFVRTKAATGLDNTTRNEGNIGGFAWRYRSTSCAGQEANEKRGYASLDESGRPGISFGVH
jgi:hypothetical protein